MQHPTKKQIEAGNKIISEYMECMCEGDYYQDGDANPYPGDIVYHKDWNWLMPVRDKIQNIREKTQYSFLYEGYTVHLMGRGCTIESVLNIPDFQRKYNNSTWKYKTSIENTWAAIVEFIKWYTLDKPKRKSKKEPNFDWNKTIVKLRNKKI
jgi:hypothetical protein